MAIANCSLIVSGQTIGTALLDVHRAIIAEDMAIAGNILWNATDFATMQAILADRNPRTGTLYLDFPGIALEDGEMPTGVWNALVAMGQPFAWTWGETIDYGPGVDIWLPDNGGGVRLWLGPHGQPYVPASILTDPALCARYARAAQGWQAIHTQPFHAGLTQHALMADIASFSPQESRHG